MRLDLKALAILVVFAIVPVGIAFGSNPTNSETIQDETLFFDTGPGRYPSISGEHKGNFTPKSDIAVYKILTYPCPGTGGHSKFVEFYSPDGAILGNATWNSYQCDWHSLCFDLPFELKKNQTYRYKIRTGSYPQITHTDRIENDRGIYHLLRIHRCKWRNTQMLYPGN